MIKERRTYPLYHLKYKTNKNIYIYFLKKNIFIQANKKRYTYNLEIDYINTSTSKENKNK